MRTHKVDGQAAEHYATDTAGEMRAPHGGTDQEAAHADDPAARQFTPSIGRVPRGGGRIPDGTEPARIRVHEAAHLAAGECGQAAGIFVSQRVPETPMGPVSDHLHREACEHPKVLRHRSGQVRKIDAVTASHDDIEPLQATRQLRTATAIGEAELPADRAAPRIPACKLLDGRNVGNVADRCHLAPRALDLRSR